ncbi:hypothetical protein [Roseomonas xinghualingensis]|uniref:hypothetical protein n=1 Tax=Roseomonas xinghualingensis TaxID=2986475 RepID=UPI0021F1C46D|nr:hypothetical protein [Roseomonas sp. SXEYE001]MCV4208897.1 hypothetical protein [Roseomonas sp. SXEYE001]
MSGQKDETNKVSPGVQPSGKDGTHTASGAPTDKAHLKDGDGSLAGSIPAGLSSRELHEVAKSDKTTDSGTS